MHHFAVIAPPFTSHVRALEALALALLVRGHRVTWLQQIDVRPLLADARIGFEIIGADTHPAGSLARIVARAAEPGGPLGLRRVIADVAASTDLFCREAPAVLRRIGATALIADQMEAGGGLVADALGLPFVSVACALPVNREPRVPLPVMPWGFAADERGLRMNDASAKVYDWLMKPHERVIARHAAAFGLDRRRTLADCLSPRAQISQTTASFDFPREAAPAVLHHVGPLRPPASAEAPLALDVVPDRPFVFASLGTLQGGRFDLFRRIARACCGEGVQLLLAHCDRLGEGQADALRREGATWVTGFAPQRAALARADAVITHAGLNTALDALEAATPMLALPIAFDQPGVAARIAAHGVGLTLQHRFASAASIGRALARLLSDVSFAQRARALGADITHAGGVDYAVSIVLDAVTEPKPRGRTPSVRDAAAPSDLSPLAA